MIDPKDPRLLLISFASGVVVIGNPSHVEPYPDPPEGIPCPNCHKTRSISGRRFDERSLADRMKYCSPEQEAAIARYEE